MMKTLLKTAVKFVRFVGNLEIKVCHLVNILIEIVGKHCVWYLNVVNVALRCIGLRNDCHII